MDIEKLRADTPSCAERVHLNNAGAALMPEPVIRAVHEHFALETRIGGYEAEDARRAEIDAAYDAIATLVGTRARNIAFTESATASFAQALTSIPFEHGDAILTTRNDYVSNQLLFLSFERRLGVRVVRAPDATGGGVDVDAVEAMLRRETFKAVCVTHIPTNSGLVQDVASIGRLCRERDVLYVVDACQSVGQMPIDVDAIGCDFFPPPRENFSAAPAAPAFSMFWNARSSSASRPPPPACGAPNGRRRSGTGSPGTRNDSRRARPHGRSCSAWPRPRATRKRSASRRSSSASSISPHGCVTCCASFPGCACSIAVPSSAASSRSRSRGTIRAR